MATFLGVQIVHYPELASRFLPVTTNVFFVMEIALLANTIKVIGKHEKKVLGEVNWLLCPIRIYVLGHSKFTHV